MVINRVINNGTLTLVIKIWSKDNQEFYYNGSVKTDSEGIGKFIISGFNTSSGQHVKEIDVPNSYKISVTFNGNDYFMPS